MSKRGCEIDFVRLQRAVDEVVAEGGCSSRNQIFARAAEKYNGGAGDQISPTVVYLRVKAGEIKLGDVVLAPRSDKALAAERADRLREARAVAAEVPRVSRSEKLSAHPGYAEWKEGIEGVVPKSYKSLAQQALRGGMRARIKFNCLQCVGFDRSEVRRCSSKKTCIFWPDRPYQREDEPDVVEGE